MPPFVVRKDRKASKVTRGLTGRTVRMDETARTASPPTSEKTDETESMASRENRAEMAWLGRKEWRVETEWTERLDEMGKMVGQPR